jgi:hypothetical protein
MAGARELTIGEAAARLAAEYPGVTVAVLRRLESAGRFTAARTASGYRRYSESDLDLLRIVLSDGAAAPEAPVPARSAAGFAGWGVAASGADPSDLSGAESPLSHPAAAAGSQGADAEGRPREPVRRRPAAPRARQQSDAPVVPDGAQRAAPGRSGGRTARGGARVPAARSGAGRAQAPSVAALFDVPPGTAPVPAYAPAPAAVPAARAARLAEPSQRPEPMPAPSGPRPGSTLAARRAERRWPDPEFFTPDLGEVALDRDQLAAAARTDRAWVDGLVEYGVLPAADSAGGADLLVAKASAELAQYGVEPRHLRAVAASAARVAELIAAATAAGSVRDPARRERSALVAPGRGAEAAAAAVRLHAALVRAALLRG